MRIDVTVRGRDGSDNDVAVVGDESTTVREIAGALRAAGGLLPDAAMYVSARELSPGDRVARVLLPGSVVTSAPAADPTTLARLVVACGPGAGRGTDLPRGDLLVGRDEDCDLVLDDPAVSRHQLRLTHDDRGVRVRDLGATNPASIDGEPISAGAELRVGQALRVGNTVLRLAVAGVPTPVRADGPGEIAWPDEPVARPRTPLPWAATSVPLVTGPVLAAFTHNTALALLVMLSPMAVVAGVLFDATRRRRELRRARVRYARAVADVRATITAAIGREQVRRRADGADPAAFAAAFAAAAGSAVGASDVATRVRLGLGDAPAQLQMRRGDGVHSAGTARLVPVLLDVADAAVTVRAPRSAALGVARWIVVQAAAAQRDVEVLLDCSHAREADWHWARWLASLSRDRRTPGRASGPRVQVCDRDAGSVLVRVRSRHGDPATPMRRVSLTQTDDTGEFLLAVDGATQSRLLCDEVSDEWADGVARALCGHEASRPSGARVPAHCRLVDLAAPRPVSPAGVAAVWERADDGLSTAIGVGAAGTVRLDLARDGPHALVAGTTGSGKSELLQTWVLGLALAYPPEQLVFVLVDYKGGAAFARCAALPHVAAVVTDLDGHATERALRSLRAELRRREAVLADAGAADLAAYRRSGAAAPLSRLVLVVDEFATLQQELPTFLRGVVDVAQRGRSLGVHLVLATQRPGGVVAPDIRANTSLRIALRVVAASDSHEVVGVRDAAEIAPVTPGRAVVCAGGTVEPVQIARVLGRADTQGPAAVPLGRWRTLPVGDPTDGRTDADTIVDAVTRAAVLAGQRRVAPPWLPPLPALLPVADVPPPARASLVPIGIADLPDEQRQEAVTLDLARGDAVAVIGAPRSGRTSTLVSVALTAASRLGADDLAIHAIDCAGGGLDPLRPLPHLAGEIRDDPDAIGRLVETLAATLTAAPASPDRPGPRQLLLVDGWTAFAAGLDDAPGRAAAAFAELLRVGPSHGITTIITGERTLATSRIASCLPTRLVLAQTDRSDFALAGVASPTGHHPALPGQALRSDGTIVQLAFAGCRPSLDEQVRVASGLARSTPSPARADVVVVRGLPDMVRADGSAAWPALTLGVGGDAGLPVTVDIRAPGTPFLVIGPPGSGRSTVLRLIGRSALAGHVPVCVATGPTSPLRHWARTNGVALLEPAVAAPAAPAAHSLLMIDDIADLADSAAGDALSALLKDPPRGLVVVAAGSPADFIASFRGPAAALPRARCGLVLWPRRGDGDVFAVELPSTRASLPPGRGCLVAHPAWRLAQPVLRLQVAVPATND